MASVKCFFKTSYFRYSKIGRNLVQGIVSFFSYHFEQSVLHVHEIEEYDFDNGIGEFKRLRIACSSCHSFLYRTYSLATKAQMDGLILKG